jgi:hypothetical protein
MPARARELLRASTFVIAASAACSSVPKSEQAPQSTPTARASAVVPAAATAHAEPSAHNAARGAATPATPATPSAPSAQPGTAKPAPEEPASAGPAEPAAELDEVQKALAYDPKDPLGNLEAADALDRMARAPAVAADVKPKRGSCAIADAGRRVWPAPGPSAIAAVGRDFVIAGYATREGREQLFVVRSSDKGVTEPIAAFEIKPPYPRERPAPPALSVRDENDIVVAFTDGAGKLWARRLRMGRGGTSPPVEIASGVDTRFAPALAASSDHTLLAWTTGTTPMHTELAVLSLEGQVRARHDVTPTSLGACAPSFVSGANPPVLLALDAHEGMSPILRVDMGAHGEPQPTQIALPVGMVSAPPRLAAASSSVGTYVGYTGLGSAATSAIGLVAIAPVPGSPQALIKGTAYGALHVSAVAGPRALVFAADAPTQAGKDPPHEIHVHVIGAAGPGPATVVSAEGGAARAAIARAEGGVLGLAFTARAGVYLARLRCDDGG